MPRIAYDPAPFQAQFHKSTAPKVLLSAGYGAGKTYALVMKAFELMNVNKGCAGGILAPTIKMFKRDVLPTFRDICRQFNIAHRYNKADGMFWFPDTGTDLYVFHAEDKGASIRGPNLAFQLMNEVTLIDEESFMAAIARVRLKNAKRLQVAMSGTPEGFNWTYEYFIEKPREDTELIYGSPRDQHHLSPHYVKMLEESYDEMMREQYVEGKFVNLKGKRCVYAFDRRKHTDTNVGFNPEFEIWVSLDFNVSPMAATLWNRVPLGEVGRGQAGVFNHELRAFGEICLPDSNTEDLCRVLRQRFGERAPITIYPDPAGRARSTKSNVTDFDILNNYGFKKIKYKNKFSVRDQLNCVNAMFSKNRIVINSKECHNLVADLEQCVYKSNGFEIDKTNPRRSHWLDGLKNMIEYEFPINRASRVQLIKWM